MFKSLEIVFSNQKAESQSGYTTKEIAGKQISLIFPKIKSLLGEALHNGNASSNLSEQLSTRWLPSTKSITTIQNKIGEEQEVHLTLIPLKEEPGYVFTISETTPSNDATLEGPQTERGQLLHSDNQATQKIQYLEETVNALTQMLEKGNPSLFREARYLPAQLDNLDTISSSIETEKNIRHGLASLLSKSLKYWELTSKKSKAELAEESGIWNASIDPQGTWRTRTLDRYLKEETLSKNPKWADVIQTTNYVLKNCPENEPEMKTQLEVELEVLSTSLKRA